MDLSQLPVEHGIRSHGETRTRSDAHTIMTATAMTTTAPR